MSNLTWSDLFIESDVLDFDRLLRQWPNTVSGKLRPIGATAFGDCFFERPAGQVEKLDLLEGGVHYIASGHEEFGALMNTRSWQEEHLLSAGVALLYERGVSRLPDQFFAFAPHPTFTGKILWDKVVAMDAIVWHSICAQLLDGRGSQSHDA